MTIKEVLKILNSYKEQAENMRIDADELWNCLMLDFIELNRHKKQIISKPKDIDIIENINGDKEWL